MGDHFSSSAKHLVGRNLNIIMKLIVILCLVGFSQSFVVRREAEADADAGGYGIGYGASPASVSAPVCKSVPQKVCKDRTIETPRKVCHTEHDEIVDTTITEHCETTTTTKCEQTSSQTRHSSSVVGSDSKVVATGIVASPEVTVARGASTHGGVISGYSAATAGAVAGYGGTIGSTGIIGTGGIIGSSGVVGTGTSLGYGGVTYGKREAEADAEARLGIMVMVPMVLVLSPPQLLSAAVFQLELVTKFLLTLQEKLPRLFARLLQMLRSSRTVQIQSAPLVHNSQSNKHTPLKLLEMSPKLGLLLLLLLMEQYP